MLLAPSLQFRPAALDPMAHRALALRLFATLLLGGCGSGDGLTLPSDGEPATIRVVHGNGLSGRVGEPLGDSLVIRVTDSRGRGLQGVSVAFELTDAGPGAQIEPATATTNVLGEADARVRLGTRMGPQTGQARVVVGEGIEEPRAAFTVTALSKDANGIAAASGDNQSGPAGSILGAPLVVEVTDQFGNAISGTEIIWTAEGGGSVSETSTTTDERGRASVVRTLGPATGRQTTLATSSEPLAGSPVTFVHTATAGSVAGLAIVSGDAQTAEAGTQVPADLVVRLTDGQGNPVPDAAVTWVVSVGAGRVTPVNGITDNAGRASTRWTLGPAPGENRVDAVVSGVGVVSFRATGTRAGPVPTVTTITNDSPDPSVAGTTFTVEFQVGSDGGTPTGTVTVTVSGGTPSCTGTLQNGRGSCALQLNITGDRTLTAVYSGAPGFAGSSDTEAHRVVTAPPQNRPPDADYNWHCEGLTCQFTDASEDPDGSIAGWNWNFGGTGSSSLKDPSHTFPGPGEYQVTLTVTDNGGATDQSTAGVEVEAPPPPPPGGTATTITGDGPDPSSPGEQITVSFTVSSPSGTPTGSVQVTDQNGGGCIGSAPSGSCSYTPNGLGTRTITATYAGSSGFNGSSDTEEHTVDAPPPAGTTTTITGDGPDPSNPGEQITVSFTISSGSGTPTGTVQVNDGIGGSCTGSAPSGSCAYTPGGTGTRTITANYVGNSSFNGSSDTEEHTVTTPPAGTSTTITSDEPDPSNPGEAVLVSFTVSSSAGTPTGTVQVTDPNGGSCTGDALSGSCSYIPGGAGPRTITATYQGNSTFNPSSDTETHTVNTPPTAEIAIESCEGLTCDFEDVSDDPDGNIDSRSWDFGDPASGEDNTSDNNNPDHTFTAPGTYTVTLTVTDDDGASDDVSTTVTVDQPNQAPTAQIGSVSCTGLNCTFGDDSSDTDGTIVSRSWNYGDNSPPDALAAHTYAEEGDYDVTLTVTDNDGASDSDEEEIDIETEG